jgi:hypothetical protein
MFALCHRFMNGCDTEEPGMLDVIPTKFRCLMCAYDGRLQTAMLMQVTSLGKTHAPEMTNTHTHNNTGTRTDHTPQG